MAIGEDFGYRLHGKSAAQRLKAFAQRGRIAPVAAPALPVVASTNVLLPVRVIPLFSVLLALSGCASLSFGGQDETQILATNLLHWNALAAGNQPGPPFR